MKYLFYFLFISNAFSVQLPIEWAHQSHLMVNKIENDLSFAKSKVEKILLTQANVLEQYRLNKTNGSNFKLNRYDASFSVTKNGILGFSTLSSTTAVEFRWTPKKNTIKPETVNFVVQSSEDQDILNLQANNLVDKILATGKIKNENNLRKNVKNYFGKTSIIFNKIRTFHSRYWMLEGLAADLSISSNGSIGGTIGTKGALRLRLEWKYSPVIKIEKGFRLSNQANLFVGSVLSELDHLSLLDKGNYSLEKVRVTLGISYKTGLVGIAGRGVSHVGRLDFKRKKSLLFANNTDSSTSEPIAFYHTDGHSDNQNAQFRFLTRRRWRKGLKKILKISDFFIKRVPQSSKQWEVSSINTSFGVSKSGFFGLVGPKSHAQIELRFLKKSDLSQYYVVSPVDEMLQLHQLRFRIRLNTYIQVPLILKLSTLSEVEFYWNPI